MKALALFALLCLCACTSVAPQLPTSPRLEIVRAAQEVHLNRMLVQKGLVLGAPVFIRAFKKEARLEVWVRDDEAKHFVPFKSYGVCKYSGVLGPKLFEGDLQTPEGFYEISAQQLNPHSHYHLSFDLGFPNEYDRVQGRTGSHLMIHGECKSEGCFAMTNEGIEEIYLLVEASIANGHDVPVHLFPFHMNEANLYIYDDPQWHGFWVNLKQGYDIFEVTGHPPEVTAKNGRYAFR